jgi:hypothetical protein
MREVDVDLVATIGSQAGITLREVSHAASGSKDKLNRT